MGILKSKALAMFLVSCLVPLLEFGCQRHSATSQNLNADAREKLFQRFMKQNEAELSQFITNRDASYTNSMRKLFNQMVIDPSFGLGWDEVPAPTMTNSNDMASVESFIKTNGWNMETNSFIFDGSIDPVNSKPIRGLPWQVIHEREFPATTEGGILYVLFDGWHHNSSGVAYNPFTNHFRSSVVGFKPIGNHWYVWALPEDPVEMPKQYEGSASH